MVEGRLRSSGSFGLSTARHGQQSADSERKNDSDTERRERSGDTEAGETARRPQAYRAAQAQTRWPQRRVEGPGLTRSAGQGLSS